MVSNLERNICYFGLFSLYSYTFYKFSKTKSAFDQKFHEALIVQGNKYIKEKNDPNLKFIDTPNQKILFLLGIENELKDLKDEKLQIFESLIENFTPNCFVYEKDLKYSTLGFESMKSKIVELLVKKESLIEHVVKNTADNSDENLDSLLKKLGKLNEEERINIFKQVMEEGIKSQSFPKDFIFDFVNLYSDYIRRMISGKGSFPYYAGSDYMRLRALIRKRLNSFLNSGENSTDSDVQVTLEDIQKMSLKERFAYKQHQLEMNSKFNLYEDIKDFIREKIENELEVEKIKRNNTSNTLKTDQMQSQVDEIFSQVAVQEVNELMINNTLNNNKLYVAVVLVRQERLQNLYEKFLEYNKNLNI